MAAGHPFNWEYLLELLIFAVLAISFLFYFNRLFASLVSYGVRTYVWHQYQAYVDIQAIQLSLLGGRCFFKGFRYHGHNETVLINDGYITWRYWLRRVRHAECFNTPKANPVVGSAEEEGGLHNVQASRSTSHSALPCRIEAKVRGVEWFIYNRSPAYEAIGRTMSNWETDDAASANLPNATSNGLHAKNNGLYPPQDSENSRNSAEEQYDWSEKSRNVSETSKRRSSVSTESSAPGDSLSATRRSEGLPAVLSILPISIECSKAAIVLGNNNTRSVSITKVDAANVHVDADHARKMDLYKQKIDFEFIHPVVELKHNRNFRESQQSTGAEAKNHKSEPRETSEQHGPSNSSNAPLAKVRNTSPGGIWATLKISWKSLIETCTKKHVRTVPEASQIPGQDRWLGLTRYLDEDDDALEHERWKTIEYGQYSTVIDSPSINMSLYWDVPGFIRKQGDDERDCNRGPTDDINGDTPPNWGVTLRINGGVISYGPWADRMRTDLQTVFFPSAYRDASPAAILQPGQPRLSTVFKLFVEFEQETTIMVPCRESSKDWKWRQNARAPSQDDRDRKGKTRDGSKKNKDKIVPAGKVRPYGWIDIHVQPDSTATFSMDLVARQSGYSNRLDLDIRGPSMSSSVNHGLLLKCKTALISCDLSNPLGWNSLRQWKIDVKGESPELFLLRDHMFLLTDLISDWTVGPSGDFHTFVPFTYTLKFDFADFKLFLNVNDSNIINDPASTEENTFIIIWGQALIAELELPLVIFHPTRSSIRFDIDAQAGGFLLSTPPWNPQHAFLRSPEVASLKDLKIDGSYSYSTSISPELTDILQMDVRGISPRVHLYGFLVRYFMKIKDNYFGEDVHFRTAEEYQEQPRSGDDGSSGAPEVPMHNKISNDLDVILSLTAVTATALLPSSLYSSEDSIILNIPSLGVDLRFTNYYMDLVIALSPITACYTLSSVLKGSGTDNVSETQVFVDGLEVAGHRLFGLPPVEPTYVCNWDFNVGSITGECCLPFLKGLSSALHCFGLSFQDAENALPAARTVELYDITFLRAAVQPMNISFCVGEVAFLLTTKECNVEYNDYSKTFFSERMVLQLPQFTLAMVQMDHGSGHRDNNISPTLAFVETSIELSMVRRKFNFEKLRRLQQHHIITHDARTDRIPWLVHEGKQIPFQSSNTRPKIRPPAMPFPPMPEPLWTAESNAESVLSSNKQDGMSLSDISLKKFVTQQNEPLFTRRALDPTASAPLTPSVDPPGSSGGSTQSIRGTRKAVNHSAFSASTYSSNEGRSFPEGDGNARDGTVNAGFGYSSAYKQPYFALQTALPDLSRVPALPHSSHSQPKGSTNVYPISQYEESERTAFFLDFGTGLRGLCTPYAVKTVATLTEELQVTEPGALLDGLQIGAVRNVLQTEQKPENHHQITEARISIRCLYLRCVDDVSKSSVSIKKDASLGLDLADLILNIRLSESTFLNPQVLARQALSIQLSLREIKLWVEISDKSSSLTNAHVQLSVDDTSFWFHRAAESTMDLHLKDVEADSAIGNIEFIGHLLRGVDLLSTEIRRFGDIRRRRMSRLRLLVYSLAAEGQNLPDPPFLTRVSPVLRGASSHLRTSESWKMVSRLRFINRSLPEHRRAWIQSQCMDRSPNCPKNARDQVLASFERFGMWDRSQLKQSNLMEEIFGSGETAVQRASPDGALRASARAGTMRLRLQSGVAQNSVTLDDVSIELMTNSPSTTTGEAIPVEIVISLQIYCSKAMVVVKWNLLELAEQIIHNFNQQDTNTDHAINKSSSKVPHGRVYRTQVVIVSDSSTAALDSGNLRALCVCRSLKSSLVFSDVAVGSKLGANLLISADAARLELQSRSRVIGVGKAQGPSIFGNLGNPQQSSDSNGWHFAAISTDVSVEILEDPLGLIDTTSRILEDEVLFLQRFMTAVGIALDSDRPSEPSVQQSNLERPHIALFLDSYLISNVILPALSYRVSGKVCRTSIMPGTEQGSDMILNFDLKEHTHAFVGHTARTTETIAELIIPPINARLVLEINPRQKSVTFHSTVEHVLLNAAAVHALLTILSRPEIGQLGASISHQSSLVISKQKHVFPTRSATDAEPQRPLLIDAHVTLAGLGIHASTPSGVKGTEGSEFRFELGHLRIKGSNREMANPTAIQFPELEIILRGLKVDLANNKPEELHPCGDIRFGAIFKATSKLDERGELVRAYQVRSNKFESTVYAETASAIIDVLGHLQESLKAIDLTNEVKGLRKLRRATFADLDTDIALEGQTGHKDPNEARSAAAFAAMYSLEMTDVQITWKIGGSVPISPGRATQDLVLSCTKIDLATRRDSAARLLIQDLQLQMVPTSQAFANRSLNSALLPEVVFNVAYLLTSTDRRLAFQAKGKSLDLRLTSQFMLPASDLRRSIALAVSEVRGASETWRASPTQASSQMQKWLRHKPLASLLINADFAGAIVYIQGRSVSDPQSLAVSVLRGGRMPQHGRYGQFTHENASSNTTLRAPGVAFKVEYEDSGRDLTSLNAEIKVDASSNVLYPTVVPLVMEISSSVKEIVSEPDIQDQPAESKSFGPKFLSDERLRTADPTTIFSNCTLNLGLRICRQEFSLSCQPIARVAATAHFDDIYVTVNTVQSPDHGQFFTLAATFSQLKASVQHVYSRESTGSFEVDKVVVSLMNSKHLGAANGISAITRISPIRAHVNAKQMQDFLLFREIWVPADIRKAAPAPATTPSTEPQTFVVQRYQQVSSAGAFPWNATVSIVKLDVQLDLGQSLGKSGFTISDFWISSKKSSDWEQDLCLDFTTAGINSTGRMSGFIDLQNVNVRTSIRWPVREDVHNEAPLIQASLGFDLLRIKIAFDYQAFLITEVTDLRFLMYNVRDSWTSRKDRLVGVVEGGKVHAFCTTTSASQGLALYQAFERLMQEKAAAYEASLKDIEKFLRRRSTVNSSVLRASPEDEAPITNDAAKAPLQLQTKVVVSLRTVNIGAFPSTFSDNQIFKLEALDASAQFAALLENQKLHSVLGMTLGQLRIALSGITNPHIPKTLEEISLDKVVASATSSRGGTILKVPKVIATMQTWQTPHSTRIDYIFKSSFQGKVDVGWNYSRIGFLRNMWNSHVRALASRLGKPLPQSAVQITAAVEDGGVDGEGKGSKSGKEKITAVVNVPQSKYQYTPLEPPVIETPQLRDMGEATPPLEWIGLHRERLPNLTHQIVIVSLLELAKEVEDAYSRILGSS